MFPGRYRHVSQRCAISEAYVSWSVIRPVFQSLVAALTLTRLDYGCSTTAGLPARQLNRLQSVLNAATRLVYSARRTKHVSPLLHELHWFRVL